MYCTSLYLSVLMFFWSFVALSGEVTDLRIVLNSTEKRLIEAKADYVSLKETSQRIRADLETKVNNYGVLIFLPIFCYS